MESLHLRINHMTHRRPNSYKKLLAAGDKSPRTEQVNCEALDLNREPAKGGAQ